MAWVAGYIYRGGMPADDGHPSQYQLTVRRPGIELTTIESQVRRPTTTLPSHRNANLSRILHFGLDTSNLAHQKIMGEHLKHAVLQNYLLGLISSVSRLFV